MLDDPKFEYVAGTAGTGKTFLMRERAASDPSHILTATTGIAAVNLGDATTINAALGYYNTESLGNALEAGYLDKAFRDYARVGVTNWILDEVSMMEADQLSMLVSSMVRVHREMNGPEFPGLSLTLVGDFAQLPPVQGKFAFASGSWQRFEEHTQLLTDIKRQTDRDFIEALQLVRKGEGHKAVEYFEPYMDLNAELYFEGTTVVGVNKEVDRKNGFRLERTQSELVEYRSSRWWDEEKYSKPPSDWRTIPEILEVKEGALVMVLSNKRDFANEGEFLYVNGDLGRITSCDDQSVWIELHRTGDTVEVKYVKREVKEPTGKKDPKFYIKAWIEYLPVRLAYATTVHKSQGLTLDKVQLVFRHWFFKSPGMLYVGLSRCRTPEGLTLIGTPEKFIEHCQVDERVRRWL